MSIALMTLACPVCGEQGDSVREWITKLELAIPGAGVCDPCAERIANAWNYAHTGRWLTRQNTPAAKKTKAVIPQSLRTQVFERDMYRCLRCSTHLDLTADHITPESKGGPTELGNLQTLCRSCNSSKGVRE